jgi:hypothetical protein
VDTGYFTPVRLARRLTGLKSHDTRTAWSDLAVAPIACRRGTLRRSRADATQTQVLGSCLCSNSADTGESQEPLRTAPTIPIARFDSSATIAAYRRYILLCAPIRCGPERSSDTTSSAQLVHATVRPIRQAIDLAVLPAHITVLCPFRPPSATGRASMQSLQPQSLW